MWENYIYIYIYILNLFLHRIGSSSVSSCRTRVCRTVDKTNINTNYICFCTIQYHLTASHKIICGLTWLRLSKQLLSTKTQKKQLKLRSRSTLHFFQCQLYFCLAFFLFGNPLPHVGHPQQLQALRHSHPSFYFMFLY